MDSTNLYNNLSETNSVVHPLISIVLATYNGEKFLEEQLKSLFEQSYKNLEIIAVDDCSSDKTVEILREYALFNTNMKVFRNEKNLGFIKNFERGCSVATGDFIAFCDQDDYWDKDKIKKQVEVIGEHVIVYCDSHICDEKLKTTGTKISDLVNFGSWSNPLQLAVFCRIYAHAMLFRKSFFDKAYPFLPIIPPDWWLPYLSTFNGGMKYLPEPLVYYRQHSANVTGVIGGKGKKQEGISKAQQKQLDNQKIRARINAFRDACPDSYVPEKKVLEELASCYESYSIQNNFRRFIIFMRYRDILLSVKKHSALHRFFFCFKMFYKIK
jgi:glycosyltransferase involved in cell wall biosynthesis